MRYTALFMIFEMLTHLNKAVQSKQFSKTWPFSASVQESQEDFLLCLSVRATHNSRSRIRLLLRKAKILQNVKIAKISQVASLGSISYFQTKIAT